MRRLAILWCVAECILAQAASPGVAREWTDRSGTYRVEAELVSLRNGKVYLEKTDGKVVAVPVERLSTEDVRHLASLPEGQAYLNSLAPEQREKLLGPGGDGSSDRPPSASSGRASSPLPPRVRPVAPRIFTHVKDDRVGEVGRFDQLGWSVELLVFFPDGRLLVVGKDQGQAVIVIDLVTAAQVDAATCPTELSSITAMAFSPDGRKLLCGGRNGRVAVWNVSPGGKLEPAGLSFSGHSRDVSSITVSAGGTHALSGDEGGTVRFWTLADAREQFAIEGFDQPVSATFITRSGKQGLACDGKLLVLLDLKAGKPIQKMALGLGMGRPAVIAPDGSCVVAHGAFGLQCWTIKTGQTGPPFAEHTLFSKPEFLPNSRYLLLGGHGTVILWDVTSRQPVGQYTIGRGFGNVGSIAASPDNRHFAAVAPLPDGGVQIFRMPPGVAAPPGR